MVVPTIAKRVLLRLALLLLCHSFAPGAAGQGDQVQLDTYAAHQNAG